MKLNFEVKSFVLFVLIGSVSVSGVSEISRLGIPANAETTNASKAQKPPAGATYISSSGAIGSVSASGGCNNIGGEHNVIDCRKFSNHKSYTYIKKTYVQYADSREGLLKPASDLTPPLPCPVPANALAVLAGSNVGWSTGEAVEMLNIRGIPIISAVRSGDSISIDQLVLFDQDGRELLHISDDGYMAAKGFVPLRPDKSTLMIYDHGEEILYVRYINKNTIVIRGKFNVPGIPPIYINKDNITLPMNSKISTSCFGESKTVIRVG